MKRDAIARVKPDTAPSPDASWRKDANILEWLEAL